MIPLLIAGTFCGTFILSAILNWLALIPWRRSVGRHWTERARLLYPARRSARANLYFMPLNVYIATSTLAPEINVLVTMIPGFLGALFGGYFLSREISLGMTFKQWLNFIVAVAVLAFGVMFVVLIAAVEIPANFGVFTWAIAACALALVVALQLGLNVWVLRQLKVLAPAPERLKQMIEEVSQKMNTPVRNVWVARVVMCNALALPVTRQLVFTEKLLAMHPDEEIKSVCAHELGHLNEPRKVLLARVIAMASFYPLVFMQPVGARAGLGPYGGWILLIPVLICAVIAIRVARQMEKRADRIALENLADPAVYARALERLYQTNQMPAVMPRRMVKAHPDLYDRMCAAGITPDFPKPAPPKKLSWTSHLLIAGIAVPIFIYAIRTVQDSSLQVILPR
jgi:Zn-dependent protease with chaperone function